MLAACPESFGDVEYFSDLVS
ncbi:MAG: hypothetical protein JWN42_600, partial [Candidatus Angelobacter sp.]|nr:hypothetical protein [Candidatus Angelobacter sp.]